jgi:hypothetical protein
LVQCADKGLSAGSLSVINARYGNHHSTTLYALFGIIFIPSSLTLKIQIFEFNKIESHTLRSKAAWTLKMAFFNAKNSNHAAWSMKSKSGGTFFSP